jgi:NAD(P)-dependent dehydrogenase (short-subunit alcohol dehydrogenase family)
VPHHRSQSLGAASGIGKASIARYTSAGASVIYATDARPEALPGIIDELRAAGYKEDQTKIIGLRLDITKSDEMESLVRRIIRDEGRLDWFVTGCWRALT